MAKFTGIARDDAGNTLASASVTVYDAGTSTLSTIYSDRAMATAETNPFNADADGAYEFHAPPAEYRVLVSKAGFNDHDEDYIPVGLANEAWAFRGDHASSHLEIEELGGNKVIRVEPGLPTDAIVVDASENVGFGSDGFADMVGPGIGLDAVGTAPTTNPSGKALLYIDSSDDHKLKVRTPSGTVYVLENVAGGTGSSPYAGIYHPDRAPTSGTVSGLVDNFDGGLEQTWTWANQSTATETAEMDTAALLSPAPSATENWHARWLDGTAFPSADTTVAMKFTVQFEELNSGTNAGDSAGTGIVFLMNGTVASPSTDGLVYFQCQRNAGNDWIAQVEKNSAYSGAGTQLGSFDYFALDKSTDLAAMYMLCRYTESSKDLSVYTSRDGMTWRLITSTTLANTPLRVGRFVTKPVDGTKKLRARHHWFRCLDSLTFSVGE